MEMTLFCVVIGAAAPWCTCGSELPTLNSLCETALSAMAATSPRGCSTGTRCQRQTHQLQHLRVDKERETSRR